MADINYKLLGLRIRKRRKQLHLTQIELAERTELSVSYISYIETGKKSPGLSCLLSIAQALNTTIDNLLTGTLSPSSHNKQCADALFAGCSPEERAVLLKYLPEFLEDVSKFLQNYAHEASP
ncbi:MAG: helix-turn-helix transcriptional regulator [Lachnospiraceae bacterium]|nr:helix-turn-helix transcriptional regulator [Lachnospiraceae bacterium]MBP3595267.1 helix-turn-helix transcriptional regulator [Lachnospiraceae bacterium]